MSLVRAKLVALTGLKNMMILLHANHSRQGMYKNGISLGIYAIIVPFLFPYFFTGISTLLIPIGIRCINIENGGYYRHCQ